MEFSQKLTNLPPFGQLHFDDSDDEMDVDIADILTPSRAPGHKSLLSPMMDEDSGLGMDTDDSDQIELESSFNGLKNTPKFSLQRDDQNSGSRLIPRRTLFGQGSYKREDGSYCKTRREKQITHRGTILKKSLSFEDSPLVRAEETEVKTAVARLTDEENLIGDGSQECSLPTIRGKHSDLKTITGDTVVALLSGRYNDVISSFRLIDCRYPYEYEGGHVMSADNIFKQTDISNILENATLDDKRHILIFYCEFSSERGPKMYRKLRSADREVNKDYYPRLFYPEIYLLHEGYKSFFQYHKNFCTPQDYKPMLHKDHSNDLRHFRTKSKSWSGSERRSGPHRLFF
ncbi:M-phase inducer phosphatase-like [Saccostrea cucullata]|uniref:M-phase inducer phosphatase-like n=1 Tax=Saccostrea cuccullata TaxID=36930 RepID=UPI002ED25BA3